jgi:DNA-binding transcriptional MerR regulator/methylmalonyl-CoA mutase cobalamin-binding subunit
MYTIKEASARTGVGAPLIRAWERRYGVVRPTRTPSGYRLYDDATLRVLLAMRSLVETGWTASEAARAIASGEVSVDEIADRLEVAAPALAPARAAAESPRARLTARFIAAAEKASSKDAEAVLDEMMASGSFEAVVDALVMPATAALGDAWAAGRLSVAAEHAASAAVARRLAAAFQAAGAPGRTQAAVGLPPGARHELGALAFATALRRRGVGVLYLGPDVPVSGWVDAIVRTRARAAVIGVVTVGDMDSVPPLVEALRSIDVSMIALGGAAATAEVARRLGVTVLPQPVVDAASVVANALGRRA